MARRTTPKATTDAAPTLRARIAAALAGREDITPRAMFGSICYMVGGNLALGDWHDALIIRIGPEGVAGIAGHPDVGPMDLTGRPMKGWAKIAAAGLQTDAELRRFLAMALDFAASLPAKEPKAKSPPRRRLPRRV